MSRAHPRLRRSTLLTERTVAHYTSRVGEPTRDSFWRPSSALSRALTDPQSNEEGGASESSPGARRRIRYRDKVHRG
jgi:hypothetical protein